ncbi:hypothetical protein ETAA8_69780 [Anatilimnocola aggregata]|uniref:DUF1553 domain-containing protein n=1 Tax=Anatilimnocola aggregata TaxID=2528021 RepID=A0A517YNL2_9BACT|nr:DUF1549 and DUF1553 domain-containing protein [Anatilimnocola aggregata]QDU31818.1 hypothetical protein ETAA8_69780 [Anatilimnocola aggregata]
MFRLPLPTLGLLLLLGQVAQAADSQSPSFAYDVVPTFYKLGCSAGECHGSFSGKGNFRLSLFAAVPEDDFLEVRGAFGRRLDLNHPRQSLLLQKPTGKVPHGGGVRLAVDSPEYALLEAWIKAGANHDAADSPQLKSIRIEPAQLVAKKSVPSEPLKVFARFSDNSERDVSAYARYETLDSGTANVASDGRVTTLRVGDTNILAHFAGQIAFVPVLSPGELPKNATFPDEPLSDAVDQLVAGKLRQLNILPAELCSDNDFLRRVYLDVVGRLPTPAEVREFVADAAPDKRARVIDQLLLDPLYSAVWANKLCDAMGADNRTMYDESVYRIYDWMRNRFDRNVPWDQIVRGAITGTVADGRSDAELIADNNRRTEARKKQAEAQKAGIKVEPVLAELTDLPFRCGPATRNTLEDFTFNLKFRVQAGERKGQMDARPLAQHVATAFLGVRLECAECHKHPHDRWSQQDFLSFTAAFSYVGRGVSQEMRDKKLNYINGVFVSEKPLEEFLDPRTGEVLPPRPLDGPVIEIKPGIDPRAEVWKWMVSPENPYFAKAMVNRVWAHYFGRGLIEPADALAAANPPSHPAVMDELTREFVSSGYDLRKLHRRILNTRTYQRDWATNTTNHDDERNFSHRVLRRMSAETVLDALADITATPLKMDLLVYGGPKDNRTVTRAIEMPLSRPRGDDTYVLRIFDKPQRTQSCDCERSSMPNLSQSMYFYNDTALIEKITAPEGRLSKLLKDVSDNNALLDELYLLTLARVATSLEREQATKYLSGVSSRAEGFEDLFWSLLNRQEFLVTH